jgi:hypothetical protein
MFTNNDFIIKLQIKECFKIFFCLIELHLPYIKEDQELQKPHNCFKIKCKQKLQREKKIEIG